VEEEVEEVRKPRSARPLKSYKIQEVIKRRQILLVQVTKEERGNKGAALTTYLSLPGRYCVLMPNTPRGGGISRKITNPADRKRMKELLEGLDVPDGMSVILRTAGIERSKPEIKRDLEYLMRLWDSIREQTLQSVAPALIYEEANLIKRSIRDLYSEDIDELHVEGDDGYRIAKDFMRMLMPSHVRKVQRYDDDIPLFHRFQVEGQIEAMFNPIVQLKSGGYIVINQTEALVAIDVNSGRSTKERNIEETALKTNLEAADEVARQLRLRDLAGLIVIDFIDMEEGRNNASVEKRLKEAMKADRARIQLGRISMFGLLELSRQRLRPSLQEINFERCPHCSGTGMIRSMESAALAVLRAIEEEGIKRRSSEITVSAATQIALYILNQKRDALAIMELKYGLRVFMHADDSLIPPEHRLERIRARGPEDDRPVAAISAEKVFAETDRALEAEDEGTDEPDDLDADEGEETVAETAGERPQGNGDRDRDGRRRRRRRRRRNGESRFEVGPESRALDAAEAQLPTTLADGTDGDDEEDEDGSGDDAGDEGGDDADNGIGEARADGNGDNGDARRKRRRGKRGGRRRARQREAGPNGEEFAGEDGAVDYGAGDDDTGGDDTGGDDTGDDVGPAAALDDGETAGEEAEPVAADIAAEAAPVTAGPAPAEEAPRKRPARGRRKPADGEGETAPAPVTVEAAPATAPAAEDGPKKRPSRSRRKTAEDTAPAETAVPEAAPTAPVADAAPAAEPAAEPAPDAAASVEEPANPAIVVNPPVEQPKKGWWSRLIKG
jgi:ribonuclease E